MSDARPAEANGSIQAGRVDVVQVIYNILDQRAAAELFPVARWETGFDDREIYETTNVNINDNTPLFIWAVWHHYKTTKDQDFLQRIYPAVWKAGQCILRARDTELAEIPPERKHGLITCTVRGVEVYGIASWRNIIPNYTLNGAVSEINAECALALRVAAPHLAEARGTPESQADAKLFREAGEALTEAMNTHLINPKTGLYYLNIDLDGNIHTDVTADEIYDTGV